jgi:hypothetical protein
MVGNDQTTKVALKTLLPECTNLFSQEIIQLTLGIFMFRVY